MKEHLGFKPELLKEMMVTLMSFGKYKGRPMYTLPVHYLEWFKKQGFPKGKIGEILELVFDIKTNGLDEIFEKLASQKL
jgi:uncharacterized protein (DUF3820 family)